MTDADKIHKLRVAIRMAANTFRVYQKKHLGKGTEEGDKKAQENAVQAAYLERIIEETSE